MKNISATVYSKNCSVIYFKEIFMKKFILTLTMFVCGTMLFAAPQIGSSRDIKFNYRAVGSAAWKKFYVVSVIYPQVPFSVQTGVVLSDLKKSYKDKNVEFFALVPTAPETLKAFADSHPEFDFTLISDVDLKYMRSLLGRKQESFFQICIFNNAGKLLWSGEAVDLDMMLKRITGNRYSEREEVRISALTNSLQAALRSGNARLIGEAADEILRLRPEQISAVNAKAYSLELVGDIAGLEKFYRERIKRNPEEKGSYFTLINAACRIRVLNNTASEIAEEFIKKFPDDISNVNAVMWSLLNDLPYDANALKVVLKWEKLLSAVPEKSATPQILMTRSLLASRCGKIAEAVKLCEKALNKANSQEAKAFPEQFLKYLKTIPAK